ncbi:hypothetical protein [Candidatus Binatus sp.]
MERPYRPRRERAFRIPRAEKVIALADHIQMRVEEFFVLDALEDGETCTR